jgi:hypothetical protein
MRACHDLIPDSRLCAAAAELMAQVEAAMDEIEQEQQQP